MLKYRLDNVSPDAQAGRNVVYAQLYDDADPGKILGSFCVPYESAEQFETALEAKTRKYLDSVAGKTAVADLVKSSFTNVETKIRGIK